MHEEILNYYTFLPLQMSKLCSSQSNICSGELWYSEMTNICRQPLSHQYYSPLH